MVSAGSYSDPERAAKVMAKLTAKGYQPYIEEIHRDGKTYRRVSVAQVRGREKAQDLADEVSGEGLEATLIAASAGRASSPDRPQRSGLEAPPADAERLSSRMPEPNP